MGSREGAAARVGAHGGKGRQHHQAGTQMKRPGERKGQQLSGAETKKSTKRGTGRVGKSMASWVIPVCRKGFCPGSLLSLVPSAQLSSSCSRGGGGGAGSLLAPTAST